MLKDLLIEIGCEEIPASFVGPALEGGERYLRGELTKKRISFEDVEITGTPRRLVYRVKGISESQAQVEETILGPPEKISFDDEGNPTKAAIGFAASAHLKIEDLEVFDTERGRYVGFRRKDEAASARDLLPEICTGLLPSLPFKKSMRWADLVERFARPVHWILALYGDEVVDVTFGNVKSSNHTFGHRFLKPEKITLDNGSEYEAELRKAFVVVNFEERKEIIRKQLLEIEKKIGYRWVEDEGLLETVTNLVEYPVTVIGRFEDSFLQLPREILIITMKEHQKYFVYEDAEGNLFPGFAAVSNIITEDMDTIVRGNERVLRARLSDADFYYKDDLKRPLIDKVEDLKEVLYQADLGSYYEKTLRVEKLARIVAGWAWPDKVEMAGRAALLSKADLVTGVVYEFPELQGEIGRDYAIQNGEEKEVCEAVFEHYLPRSAGDDLPSTETGMAVSIGDKVDTICGCFAVGLIPTGTQDPYALRRQVIGILHIILERGLDISLSALVDLAIENLRGRLKRDVEEITSDVMEFFRARLLGIFSAEYEDQEVIEAVLNAGYANVLDAQARVKALSGFKGSDAYESLITGFKRAQNITKGWDASSGVSPDLFVHGEERELYDKIVDAEGAMQKMAQERSYTEALEILASLRDPIDRFFEKVLVMDKDEAQKRNKLSLLVRLTGLFSWIADFSKSGK